MNKCKFTEAEELGDILYRINTYCLVGGVSDSDFRNNAEALLEDIRGLLVSGVYAVQTEFTPPQEVAHLTSREAKGYSVGEIEEGEDGNFAVFNKDARLPPGTKLYTQPAAQEAAIVSAVKELIFAMEISGVVWRDKDNEITSAFDKVAAILKEDGHAQSHS